MKNIVLNNLHAISMLDFEYDELVVLLRLTYQQQEFLHETTADDFMHGLYARQAKHLLELLNPKHAPVEIQAVDLPTASDRETTPAVSLSCATA